jgi:hypothetical protein
LAASPDGRLILRGERETQAARLAQDNRLRPAPGRDGWIAIALVDVADADLPGLLSDAHRLAGAATR